MRGKLLFVVGLAAGYIVGARAGRPAYDAIAERLRGTAENPTVRAFGRTAKEALEDKAPQVAAVAGQVAETASGAAEAVATAGKDEADPAPERSPGAAGAGGSGAAGSSEA